MDIICIGAKCYLVAKSPLGDPVKQNDIPAGDISYLDLRDFPFQSPTRCVITTRSQLLRQRKEISEREVAIYPPTVELTSQEEKTGVKTIIVSVPAFMSFILERTTKSMSNKATAKKIQAGLSRRSSVKKTTGEVRKAIQDAQNEALTLYQDYAQYVLMKRKFRQRTGLAVLKFHPYLLPGFPGRLEDPISVNGKPIATVDCFFSEITHNLSYSAPAAQTTVAVSYIRYKGELTDPKLKKNPIFPSFTPSGAAETVVGDAFGV